MKRFLCVCMCIFILTISVLTYFPTCAYAAEDFTLSTAEGGNISSDEANRAVNNKCDIYNANHEILFRYTPTSDYNWTYVNWDVHCSDAQVVACLRSNNKFEAFGALLKAGVSHNALSRVMLSQLGFLVSENSELGTDFLDRITGNYNYLNAIKYDPQTGDLTLLADQVTALRNELKERYYNSIGIIHLNVTNGRMPFSSSLFEEQDDYTSAYNLINSYDYQFAFDASFYGYDGREVNLYCFNRSSFSYCYYDYKLCFVDSSLNNISQMDVFNCVPTIYQFDEDVHNSLVFTASYKSNYYSPYFDINGSYKAIGRGDWCSSVYSVKYNDFLFFKSYEALYNYVHGSQNAYLSSKVQEAGEDIKLSINNMNDNIGSKMDELIDSINNKKDGMSADELQKAIDKALDSISGKIDNIGNNTQETNNKLDALLESVAGTNQILMQILGVTTDIRDIVKTKDEEGNQYTMSDVKNCFNTMFNNLKYSILYAKNVTNNPDTVNVSTAAYVSYSDVSYADTSAETLDYKDGLLGKFPFSVPYQMYEWLQVLQVDEKVPQFTYNYGFLIGQKGKQEYDLTFDLSKYQPWADVLKSFLRLSFTLIMSVFIYNKFKGEM